MFSMLYGTGFVEGDTDLVFEWLTPQLLPLQQEKIKSASGLSDRH